MINLTTSGALHKNSPATNRSTIQYSRSWIHFKGALTSRHSKDPAFKALIVSPRHSWAVRLPSAVPTNMRSPPLTTAIVVTFTVTKCTDAAIGQNASRDIKHAVARKVHEGMQNVKTSECLETKQLRKTTIECYWYSCQGTTVLYNSNSNIWV